jgi:hypothetical protein
MRAVIDRFEGDYAVCEKEDRTMVNIPKNKLPARAKEGDVLAVVGNHITIDTEETEKRHEEIRKHTDKLWNK